MHYKMEKKDIRKNIKDLEYANLLNKESIILVLIGTAVVSVILTPHTVLNIAKIWLIAVLTAFFIVMTVLYNKRLNKIREEIQNF